MPLTAERIRSVPAQRNDCVGAVVSPFRTSSSRYLVRIRQKQRRARRISTPKTAIVALPIVLVLAATAALCLSATAVYAQENQQHASPRLTTRSTSTSSSNTKLTVGACLVTLGRHDVDNNGGLNATEFATAAQLYFFDVKNCTSTTENSNSSNASSTTATATTTTPTTATTNTTAVPSIAHDLLQVYWNGIFLQAACTCQDYEADLACCNAHPFIYRPGHYDNSQYTYEICAILNQAIELQCAAISMNSSNESGNGSDDDSLYGGILTNLPTPAPLAFIDVANDPPTMLPTAMPPTSTTTTGAGTGTTDNSTVVSVPVVVEVVGNSRNSDTTDRNEQSTDPWLVAVWVITAVTAASLVGTILAVVYQKRGRRNEQTRSYPTGQVRWWRRYWQRTPWHDAVTVAKGSVVGRKHVLFIDPTEHNDLTDRDIVVQHNPNSNDTAASTIDPERALRTVLSNDEDDDKPLSPYSLSRGMLYETPYSSKNTSATHAEFNPQQMHNKMTDLLFDSSNMRIMMHSSTIAAQQHEARRNSRSRHGSNRKKRSSSWSSASSHSSHSSRSSSQSSSSQSNAFHVFRDDASTSDDDSNVNNTSLRSHEADDDDVIDEQEIRLDTGLEQQDPQFEAQHGPSQQQQRQRLESNFSYSSTSSSASASATGSFTSLGLVTLDSGSAQGSSATVTSTTTAPNAATAVNTKKSVWKDNAKSNTTGANAGR